MATEEQFSAVISEIAARPKNVEFEELERILSQLNFKSRKTKHGHLFTSPEGEVLMLNYHNNGQRHLPSYCVRDFCKLMTKLGFYD